jgi:hypothetical protein
MLLLRDETKTANLVVFFIRSFFISYVLTSIIWFVSLEVMAPPYFAYSGSWFFIYSLIYVILPRSLLPVAISAIVYGIVKTKLKPWGILLSTWCVSVFVVFAAYDIWWSLFVQPNINHSYSSGAGAIVLGMLLVFLAFFIACVLSVFYLVIRKPDEKLPL